MKLGFLEKTSSPVARKRTVNRAVRWVMWSPDRARTVITSVVVVLVVAVGVFAFRSAVWVQQSQYEAQRAAYEAQQAAPTTSSATYGGLVVPEPSPSSIPLPVPLESAAVVPDPEKAPQAAAKSFLTAWTAASGMTSQTAWLKRLQPHTAPSLLALFKSTDRTKVPNQPITGMSSITVPDLHTSSVSAQMGSLGYVSLTLSDTTGRWLVTDVSPNQ